MISAVSARLDELEREFWQSLDFTPSSRPSRQQDIERLRRDLQECCTTVVAEQRCAVLGEQRCAVVPSVEVSCVSTGPGSLGAVAPYGSGPGSVVQSGSFPSLCAGRGRSSPCAVRLTSSSGSCQVTRITTRLQPSPSASRSPSADSGLLRSTGEPLATLRVQTLNVLPSSLPGSTLNVLPSSLPGSARLPVAPLGGRVLASSQSSKVIGGSHSVTRLHGRYGLGSPPPGRHLHVRPAAPRAAENAF